MALVLTQGCFISSGTGDLRDCYVTQQQQNSVLRHSSAHIYNITGWRIISLYADVSHKITIIGGIRIYYVLS